MLIRNQEWQNSETSQCATMSDQSDAADTQPYHQSESLFSAENIDQIHSDHNIDEEIIHIRHQWDNLRKKQELKIIQEEIDLLRETRLNDRRQQFSSDNKENLILHTNFISTLHKNCKWSADGKLIVHSTRQRIKLKKLSIYHEKFIKKHLSWTRDAKITFYFSSEDFLVKSDKVLYSIQYLTDELKETWF